LIDPGAGTPAERARVGRRRLTHCVAREVRVRRTRGDGQDEHAARRGDEASDKGDGRQAVTHTGEESADASAGDYSRRKAHAGGTPGEGRHVWVGLVQQRDGEQQRDRKHSTETMREER
jgi:hypothetical protein